MIKTDGLCISQPICLAGHYNTTPMSGSGGRTVMKFAVSLEYLPTQLASRCRSVTLSAKSALCCKTWESFCCGFYMSAMFFLERVYGIWSNHFLGRFPGINSPGSTIKPSLSVHILDIPSASDAQITFSSFQRGQKWNMLKIKYPDFFSS